MPRSPASIETRRRLASPFPLSVSEWESGEFRNSYLCGDDVELELLPIVVGLFEGLNLTSQRQIISYRVEQKKKCWLTSVSVHVLIRSRNLLKRICSAGT